MEKQRLVTCIMGQNCERFISMCLDSIKDADEIVFCDGGSTDSTLELIKKYFWKSPERKLVQVITNKYNQEDKTMNGKQRNFYLKFLKNNYPNYWAICIDSDEVIDDLSIIKNFIQDASPGVYSVKMRHFIGDLGHEDSTQEKHFVPNRLFKISEAESYPEVEHPVLQAKKYKERPYNSNNQVVMSDGEYYWLNGFFEGTTIWHLSYIPNLWEIKKKYENHLKKSNMHTPKYLHDWYYSHLFGTYPKKQINLDQIPAVILKGFGIDKDEIYFENRMTLDVKHFIDAIYLNNWLKEFIENPRIIDFGCGVGLRVWAMNMIGLDCYGNELSKYAIDNSYYPSKIRQGDITKGLTKINEERFNVSMAYDVLEHLKYEDLDKGINTMIENSDKIIFVSVPYKGTSNCDADPTHIIKESREWWISKFIEKGLKLIETPKHFLFREQILIFEK